MFFMLLPSLELPCASALPDRRVAAALIADPLTARFRKSLLVRIIEVSTPGHFLANTSATCFFIYSAGMQNAFAVPNHQCSFRAALVVAHFFSREIVTRSGWTRLGSWNQCPFSPDADSVTANRLLQW